MNIKELIQEFNYQRKKYDLNILSFLLSMLFKFEAIFYSCKCINFPKEKCVFAIWHAHQCALFSCAQYGRVCAMVSSSYDGEIISRAANAVGVETVRGSKTRGGSKASLEMIKKIKNEDCNGAITIDGPKGPKRIVKKGIIEIAKMSGVPIVPATYWSPQKTYVKFKSWDGFRFPLIGTKLILLFGEPIQVPENLTKEETENIRQQIENSLNDLYDDAKKNYEKYLKIK